MKNKDFKILEIRDKDVLVKDSQGMKIPVARYEDERGVYFLNGQLEKQYVPELIKQFHLKELGISKAVLKRGHESCEGYGQDEPEKYQQDLKLLNKRTQRYSRSELESILGYYWTGHDQCVMDNADLGEHSHVEVYQNNLKWEKIEEIRTTYKLKI